MFRIAIKYLLTFSVFLTCVNVMAQLKVVAKIDTVAKTIYADNLDNIYLVTQSEELLKYNAKGELKWRYSNNRFGKLNSADVSDPLRVVLFYADFQQVVVLNNNLNEVATYSFSRNSNLMISALASANNNGFWAFDRTNNVLLKLSNNFSELTRSSNLYQLFDEVIVPKKMVATDQFVYLQKSDNQILQFDAFGAFIKPLPIDSLGDFNITINKIAYLQKGKIRYYNVATGENKIQDLPLDQEKRQVAVGNKLVAVLTEKAVFLLSGN